MNHLEQINLLLTKNESKSILLDELLDIKKISRILHQLELAKFKLNNVIKQIEKNLITYEISGLITFGFEITLETIQIRFTTGRDWYILWEQSKPEQKCQGCQDESGNQLAHLGSGGCLNPTGWREDIVIDTLYYHAQQHLLVNLSNLECFEILDIINMYYGDALLTLV